VTKAEPDLPTFDDSQSQNARSTTTVGGGLANKISLCMSRIMNCSQARQECAEDIEDLIYLVQELNQHTELNVKVSSTKKIQNLFQDIQSGADELDMNDPVN